MINVVSTRLYPAFPSGDIQAINAGSSHVHIHLQYEMWTEEWKNAHQTKQKKYPMYQGNV